MYKDELLDIIYNSEGEQKHTAVNELFVANRPLLHAFAKKCGVLPGDWDDFYQVCYFGYLDALKTYQHENSKFSFSAYYGRCVFHKYYIYKKEMAYPVKLTEKSYRRVKETESPFVHIPDLREPASCDDRLYEVENRELKKCMWDIVCEILNRSDLKILLLRYQEEYRFKQIGMVMNMTETQVRSRHSVILKKLRRSNALRELASDF